ncbi:hypothetical protein HPB49_003606 [Dermacentor silvarum]|uniref:Uncharacterized protein n=1 Tax=Dermacentor silvarum TaxID=543639 RepID=A0ACB8CPD9_DERSI|nr:hypothetical protein HPB49_003606 [Dermacentor silvarum]
MNGHVTTSTPGKTLQPKRWKPKVVPKFGTEDAVAVVKPRGTLNLSNFKGSNQIGEAMYAAAGVPRSSQALTIWPAWDQNIIIVGIRDAQFIQHVLSVESLRIGGPFQAVQVYLKMTDNTCRGVIQVDPKVSEADISEAVYSPDAPVVGGRKVPFNVFYWGAAVPVRLYRKTTQACTLCGTVGHRVDVCPNPRDDRCRACGSVTPGEGHQGSEGFGGLERKLRSRSRLNRRYQKRGPQRGPPGRDLKEAVVQLTIIKLEELEPHVPETPTVSAMEEDASLPRTQQAVAPATQVAEKREEENSNVVAREIGKKATVTQEEARIEADVERCLQRKLPRLEARIAQDIKASLERNLQTIIERSVQAAIERGSHGAICLDYNKHRKPRGHARLTGWSLFRKAEDPTLTAPIEKYEEWAQSFLGVRDCFTRTLQTSEEVRAIDDHLLHIWEARRGLTRRWKRQKYNRKLKIKISELTSQAEEYARTLAKNNWLAKYDSLKGSLGTTVAWPLLRCLIEPTKSRGEQQRNLKRALHSFAGTDEQLVAALTSKYICTMKDNEPVREYEGMENPDLDREFEFEEIRAVLMAMRRSMAPGNDNVTLSESAEFAFSSFDMQLLWREIGPPTLCFRSSAPQPPSHGSG